MDAFVADDAHDLAVRRSPEGDSVPDGVSFGKVSICCGLVQDDYVGDADSVAFVEQPTRQELDASGPEIAGAHQSRRHFSLGRVVRLSLDSERIRETGV